MPPFGGNPWWVYLAAALPALLVTILIFMDQQITAVIVNRKEHKLKVRLNLLNQCQDKGPPLVIHFRQQSPVVINQFVLSENPCCYG